MARRRNVQEQNAAVLSGLYDVATKVRREGLPLGAECFLANNGIDLASSAVVFVETANYMLGLEYGVAALIVTGGERIWKIELELDASLENVLSVNEFADITDKENLSQHNPGFGWGWGALAIEAKRRLNET